VNRPGPAVKRLQIAAKRRLPVPHLTGGAFLQRDGPLSQPSGSITLAAAN